MSPVRPRLLLWAVLVVLLVAGVASASVSVAARWSRPRVLAADVGNTVRAMGVRVASSQAVAAWASARGVFAAVAGVGGRFGVPQRLSGVGVVDDLTPEILVGDARGDALVLWRRTHPDVLGRGLAGRCLPSTGGLGSGLVGRVGSRLRRLMRNAELELAR